VKRAGLSAADSPCEKSEPPILGDKSEPRFLAFVKCHVLWRPIDSGPDHIAKPWKCSAQNNANAQYKTAVSFRLHLLCDVMPANSKNMTKSKSKSKRQSLLPITFRPWLLFFLPLSSLLCPRMLTLVPYNLQIISLKMTLEMLAYTVLLFRRTPI
jgi:hypothetical protein